MSLLHLGPHALDDRDELRLVPCTNSKILQLRLQLQSADWPGSREERRHCKRAHTTMLAAAHSQDACFARGAVA